MWTACSARTVWTGVVSDRRPIVQNQGALIGNSAGRWITELRTNAVEHDKVTVEAKLRGRVVTLRKDTSAAALVDRVLRDYCPLDRHIAPEKDCQTAPKRWGVTAERAVAVDGGVRHHQIALDDEPAAIPAGWCVGMISPLCLIAADAGGVDCQR